MSARGILVLIFAGYVPLASQSPYSIIVTFGQICNFRDPNLVTLFFTYRTNIPIGLLTGNMYEERSYPKNQKVCDPIPVTLLKTRLRDRRSRSYEMTDCTM